MCVLIATVFVLPLGYSESRHAAASRAVSTLTSFA